MEVAHPPDLEHADDGPVTLPRLLRFQATAFGYALLLVAPIFGLLIFVSSLEITRWDDGTETIAPPVVDEPQFFTAVFTLIVLGWVAWGSSFIASLDPHFTPYAGPKMAVFVSLPWMALSASFVYVLFLGVPAWAGFAVHFNHLDMVGFVVAAVVSVVGIQLLGLKLSPRIQPEAHLSVAEKKKDLLQSCERNKKAKDEQASNTIAWLIFSLSILSVIVACMCPSRDVFYCAMC